MRVIDAKDKVQAETTISEIYSGSSSHGLLEHKSYHELADNPVHEVDALALLGSNIEALQDLQARLSFVMREVRYLMKV